MNSKVFAFLSGIFIFIFFIGIIHFGSVFFLKNQDDKMYFYLKEGKQKNFSKTSVMDSFFGVDKIKKIEPNLNNLASKKIKSKNNLKNNRKYVALTFDDGPHKNFTLKLLKILEEKKALATFFVLGQNAEKYPDLIKKIHSSGNEVASHSYSHPAFSKLSSDEISLQINKTSDIIENITNVRPTLFRPPYGDFNDEIFSQIDMNFILWSVDSMDWKNRNIAGNLRSTLPWVQNGSIILFHDIHEASVDTIPSLIDDLRAKGYEFITVSDLYEITYNNQMNLKNKKCYSMARCK